ncbi:hypothetical protein MTO96_049069 [Rhipicephalus appendiculatus]
MPKVVENMQLGFAGCRTAFRRCCRWLTCSGSVPGREPRDQYEVLCLGLTGAGKSTALATLVGGALGCPRTHHGLQHQDAASQ